MTRNHRSAKAAGTRFETEIARALAEGLGDDRIERRARSGAQDRGDISGLRWAGHRIVIECKNTTRPDLPRWKREADTGRGNDDALIGLIAHKRHGTGDPRQQWITCTLADLIALWTGERPDQ